MASNLSSLLTQSFGKISLTAIFQALLLLVLCLVVIRVLMKILRKLVARSKLDERMQRYLLSGLKLLFYIISAIIVVGSLGVDMTSLVALLSVASLGVTLAAEDVLANIAGGLVILSSHPFAIGDYIEVSGTSGTVEEIRLNHTKLVTPDGLVVMLPNKALADSQMTNHTSLGRRRVTQVIGASYDASTESVRAACMQALANTEHVMADPAPAVYVTNYGDSAIEYTIYCWTPSEYYLPVKFSLTENLRPAFEAYHVEMTYNHLNVHIMESR